MKKHFKKKIKVLDAKTTPSEIFYETMVNFFYGLAGNTVIVFIAKEMDVFVFINFILYYMFLSFIVNRKSYETNFGKFIILPGSASLGAFTGYKLALYFSSLI